MVFCGRPSKACQRCRERKLRCDLRKSSCSSCIRAGAQCTGYRDTLSLRIHDQTQSVRDKAVSKRLGHPYQHSMTFSVPKSYPYSLEVQARDLFFAYYITDFSKTWDFLTPFYYAANTPSYLTLSIDAVSLAFLSHQLYSSSALSLSRQKYISALRQTQLALENPATAKKETTLDASLLLDLFENMTNSGLKPCETNRAHVNGALTLVKLRGLYAFRNSASLRVLMRLIINFIITCVSARSPLPPEISTIRAHAAKFMDVQDPKWRLSGLMIDYTSLVSEMNTTALEDEESVRRCIELEKKYEQLALDMPPSWMYKRTFIKEREKSERILQGYYDVYPNRTLTQTWNVLRLTRILLCEEVLERCRNQAEADEECLSASKRAHQVVEVMVKEICASVPQMTDCGCAARHKLPKSPSSPSSSSPNVSKILHWHTPSHNLDVYILLFSLYVSVSSRACPSFAQDWVKQQFKYIAKHFGIKEAGLIDEILRREERKEELRTGPWEVYQLLGSVAFAA
ncbi:putative C6 transcription factor [Zopfia rhizophila CBS 207.26]|uniref:Putative C6 transcription factor n=1 Tax=Zopfia rhizophila CBS 207.26 TaxID=1314779 RepID=A0A6A6EHL0_9PEZI|nr:putative C6 transcription factor [Zopfia rhizophila CBS 207.26]